MELKNSVVNSQYRKCIVEEYREGTTGGTEYINYHSDFQGFLVGMC